MRILGLALLLAGCAIPHVVTKATTGRSSWPRHFLRVAARIAGAKVKRAGEQPRPHTLLVANHISWLDILVMGSATGCAFVSKDDLGHPLIHWLADQNGTIYIDRSARRDAPNQVAVIQRGLTRARPVAIFPEGTVGPGNDLLPFRSTLLAAMAPGPAGAMLQPVAIDYGAAAGELSWHDEPALRNTLRILGRRGTFQVIVRMLDPLPPANDRKLLASLARERISAAMAASDSQALPL